MEPERQEELHNLTSEEQNSHSNTHSYESGKSTIGFLESIKKGLQGSFTNPSIWYLVLPVISILALITYSVIVSLVTAFTSNMAYEDGAGLSSGNPTPFLILAFLMIVLGTLIMPIPYVFIEHAKVRQSTKGFGLSPSELFEIPKSSFAQSLITLIIVMGTSLLVSIPLSLLNLGATMTNGNTSTVLNVLTLLFPIVMLLVAPFISYTPTLITDQWLGNKNISQEVTPLNAIIKVKDELNFKENYKKLFFFELGYNIILALSALTIIGIIFAIPSIFIARALLYRTIKPYN